MYLDESKELFVLAGGGQLRCNTFTVSFGTVVHMPSIKQHFSIVSVCCEGYIQSVCNTDKLALATSAMQLMLQQSLSGKLCST